MAFREFLNKKVRVHLNSDSEEKFFIGRVLRRTEMMIWFSNVQIFIYRRYSDHEGWEESTNGKDRVVPVVSINYMEIMAETDE